VKRGRWWANTKREETALPVRIEAFGEGKSASAERQYAGTRRRVRGRNRSPTSTKSHPEGAKNGESQRADLNEKTKGGEGERKDSRSDGRKGG